MPIYQLPDEDDYWFPDPEEFEGDIIAVGGNLDTRRLISAYSKGIFPWYNDPGEILWWCPEDRCVLYLDEIRVSHSMRNVFNRNIYRVTMDTDFRGVLEGCRSGVRKDATWLLDEMVEAYEKLHKLGIAHSVEVWKENELVGGLYGLSMGHIFYGESMFSKAPNSSKAGIIMLAHHLRNLGWKLIDCQVYNDHLGSLGAKNIPREKFLEFLSQTLQEDTILGSWKDDFERSVQTFGHR